MKGGENINPIAYELLYLWPNHMKFISMQDEATKIGLCLFGSYRNSIKA